MSDQQPPEGEAPKASFDTSSQIRGGPVLTLAIPVRMESGYVGIRWMVAHATGHDDHVFDSALARASAAQLIQAADIADEENRKRIDTYSPEDLKRLGPPGNGDGGTLHVPGT